MATTNPTRIVTGEVRLSYAHIWEPNSIQGGKPKYSVSLIIPKSDTATIAAIEKAVDAARSWYWQVWGQAPEEGHP